MVAMKTEGKRGMQLAISTIVVLVLAVLILIVLVLAFTGVFGRFWEWVQGYSASDVDRVSQICQGQCDLGNVFSYCCETKAFGKERVDCLDGRLNVECDINCVGVCGVDVTG